jgi:hypothetical protein
MAQIPFDADEFYSALVESGVDAKKADVLTKAVIKLENAKLEEPITKRDLAEMKADIIKTVLIVGSGIGITLIFAAFILFMRMTGKV